MPCLRFIGTHRSSEYTNLVGFDLVEVCPPYDHPGEITSVLAANLTFEFLSLLAIGAKARR